MAQLLVTTGEAARMLRVCEDTVRRFERTGELKATRTSSNFRVFGRDDVQRLAIKRQQRRPDRTFVPAEKDAECAPPKAERPRPRGA